jgi:hypothetical protein
MSFYSAGTGNDAMWESGACHELIADVFSNLLDEAICDPELEAVLESVPKEPLYYFAQLSRNDKVEVEEAAPDKQDILKSILR